MARRRFNEEFKREAVHLVTVRGVTTAQAAQAARDLDVHATVLRRWILQAEGGGAGAFPGNGRMAPDDEELRRLRREAAEPEAERDILKCRSLLRQGPDLMFWFVARAPRDLADWLDGQRSRRVAERVPRLADEAAERTGSARRESRRARSGQAS